MSVTLTHSVCTDYLSTNICALFAPDKPLQTMVSDAVFTFSYIGIACALLYFIGYKNDRKSAKILPILCVFLFLLGLSHGLTLFATTSTLANIQHWAELASAITFCLLLYRMYSADLLSAQSTTSLFGKKNTTEEIKSPSPSIHTDQERLKETILRDSTDSADVGILVLNQDGKIKIANNKACDILGYEKSNIENKPITGIIDQDFLTGHQQHLPCTEDEPQVINLPKTIYGVHQSGSFIPLEISLKKARFDTDILFLSLRDIADKLETEKALANSQSITDNILHNLPMGIHIYDVTHDVLTLTTDNQMAHTLLGSDTGFFLSDPRLLAMMKEQAICGEGTLRTTVRRLNSDSHQNLRLYLFKVTTNQLVVMFEDITLQKKYEDQLIKQESMTRRAINASIAGVYIFDTQERGNLFINDRYTAITGYSYDDLIALKGGISSIIHPDDRRRLRIHLRQILRDQGEAEPFSIQYRVQHARGHWLWVMGQDVIFERDSNGIVSKIIGSFLDITPLKSMQENLLALKDKAEEANRLKTEFLANMSHEIRTPMNAIIALTDMVLDMDMADNQREYLKKIQTSSRSLLQLLNDILDYSKLEAGKFDINHEPFDLYRVLSNVLHLFQTTAVQKGLSISASVDASVPRFVLGDAPRIGQILNNLLGNAIKFTEKGYIDCSVSAKVNPVSGAHIVSFVIEDTGIGIEEQKLTALFKSFSQADSSISRRFGGTGLGLSICRRLAGLLNGELLVSSTVNKGSTFTLKVPLTKNTKADSLLSRTKTNTDVVIVSDNQGIEADLDQALGIKNKRLYLPSDLSLSATLKTIKCDVLVIDLTGLSKAIRPNVIQKLPTFSAYNITTGIIILHTEDDIAGHCSHNQLLVPVTWLCAPFLIPDIEDAYQYLQKKAGDTLGESAAVDGSIHFHNTSVLVVEDNTTNQFVAKALLSAVGIRVIVANNGEEGVREFKRSPTDLVLMDLQMPVMDGFTAASKIRSSTAGKNVPIFAMSAAVMAADKERVVMAGMDGHISKPIVRDTLYQTLAEALPHRYQNNIQVNNSPSPQNDDPLTMSAIIDNMPHDFAIEAALQRLGNSAAIYLGLLENFYRHLQELKDKLAEDYDNETLRRHLHTLKGLSRSVGATRLAEQSEAIEALVTQGKTVSIQSLNEIINDTIDKVGEALKQILPKVKQKTITPTQSIDHLINQLRCRAYLKVDEIHPYASMLSQRFGDENSANIIDAISKLDYQRALKLMCIDTHS
ncbi:ATP-binding protein [Alteromonas sp. C1M14]|uniref:ATP-binding protein n=1 Tax=Alteromonas sp. C1M14 TaxID=2841567 RepID=UPI001C088215|nr:ATP-binding protein [Alteromonas sp. C1M14]MBU2977119.1 PAS domain S-box protein [Alteromonas sp. C1M14]